MAAAINYGVWGLGRIGFVHIKHFPQEYYNLVAGCDCEQGKLDALSADYGAAGYTDAAAFLAHPGMELVIIATRSLDHVAHARQALAAGKLVLLEKPIAVHEDDFTELQKVAGEYPGKLFFLHNHRFEPAFQHICRIVTSGVLGDIHTVKLCRHHPFSRRADWQSVLKFGGGQLNCWGPHVIDHGLQLLQSRVRNIWSDLKHIHALGDADDHVKIILTGENNRVVDIEISDSAALQDAFCTVHGSRGTLVCPDQETIRLKYIDEKFEFEDAPVNEGSPSITKGENWRNDEIPWVEKTERVESDNNMWVQVEIEIARHLQKALREDVPFPITTDDAFEVVRVMNEVKKQNSQFDWQQ